MGFTVWVVETDSNGYGKFRLYESRKEAVSSALRHGYLVYKKSVRKSSKKWHKSCCK